MCLRRALRGTVVLAHEGINATLAGEATDLKAVIADLGRRFAGPERKLDVKWSALCDDEQAFRRMSVKVRTEIVSFGEDVDPTRRTGEQVDVARWHELLNDPDAAVIDTRNAFETGIGTFPGAIGAGTQSFREFPAFVRERLDPRTTKRVALFCTGGIRCEKASALLLERGFAEVYQLDGGILKYLDEVAPEENRWVGDCFVFDQRVSVDAGLHQGRYEQCRACRRPLAPDDLESPDYEPGVSCPQCIGNLTDDRRTALMERRRQVELAHARGETHIGADMACAGAHKSACAAVKSARRPRAS